MDANVEAVKILTIGWGWTEERAYLAVLNRLWQVKRSAQAVPDLHPPDPCIEIADLVRRFPWMQPSANPRDPVAREAAAVLG